MLQKMLMPLKCTKCKKDYYETGYLGDGRYCFECSMTVRREEEEKKKQLAKKAALIAKKYNLDLDQYANELPEDVRRYLNPKNAGRKEVKYRPEYCELLIDMASEGKSESEFAAAVGISQSLISYWTENNPRFKQAREIAAEQYSAWLQNFYRNAMTNNVPCQSSLLLRMVSVKLGWNDKSESTVKGDAGILPVVKIVERDAGFPSQKLEPTAEQIAEAGLDKAAV